jgi:hypothetical protein
MASTKKQNVSTKNKMKNKQIKVSAVAFGVFFVMLEAVTFSY